jgi:DNA primase small subunit
MEIKLEILAKDTKEAIRVTNSEFYVKKLFQAYYREHLSKYPEISMFEKREFAFLHWMKPGMVRHIGYSNRDTLLFDLVSNGPRHSYRSAALYQNPSDLAMDKKNLLGCDFVVDIDADHLPTSCANKHNYSICQKCNAVYPGDKNDACKECEHTKFRKITWICDECLDATKVQIRNLVENFLLDDLSIPENDIQLYFSGHRGYHIHLESEALQHLNQDARRDLVDYMTGQGFSLKLAQFGKVAGGFNGFRLDQWGWAGKYAKKFYQILSHGEPAIRQIFEPVLPANMLKILIEHRDFLRDQLDKHNPSWYIKGAGESFWMQVLDVLRHQIMADVDVVVSIDLHRLIRLEGSIHGKSGFYVKEVPYTELSQFDPLSNALAFPVSDQNLLKLKITSPVCPKIRIGEKAYGPFTQDEIVSVPVPTALFLLCKEVAELEN